MIKYLTEFIGTFIFLSVILASGGEAVPIGIGLMAAVYFGGKISGGHFNPAVSIMNYFSGSLQQDDLPFYVIAQIAGGLAALYIFNEFNGAALKGGAVVVASTQ
jgi:aquaporin Z